MTENITNALHFIILYTKTICTMCTSALGP